MSWFEIRKLLELLVDIFDWDISSEYYFEIPDTSISMKVQAFCSGGRDIYFYMFSLPGFSTEVWVTNMELAFDMSCFIEAGQKNTKTVFENSFTKPGECNYVNFRAKDGVDVKISTSTGCDEFFQSTLIYDHKYSLSEYQDMLDFCSKLQDKSRVTIYDMDKFLLIDRGLYNNLLSMVIKLRETRLKKRG